MFLEVSSIQIDINMYVWMCPFQNNTKRGNCWWPPWILSHATGIIKDMNPQCTFFWHKELCQMVIFIIQRALMTEYEQNTICLCLI